MEKLTRQFVMNEMSDNPNPESLTTEEVFKIGNAKKINREIQDFKCNTDYISDGYHTFGELYHHRALLTASLMRLINGINFVLSSEHTNQIAGVIGCWKSKQHNDGTMYDGFFIAGFSFYDETTGKTEYATYHYEMQYWELFKCNEIEKAPPFDGHDADDTITRIYHYIDNHIIQ